MEEFTAWAIDTQSPEGHGLLGRYFFSYPIPASAEGCLTALFRTRQIAREHRNRMFTWEGDGWKPKVIKVKVVISEST